MHYDPRFRDFRLPTIQIVILLSKNFGIGTESQSRIGQNAYQNVHNFSQHPRTTFNEYLGRLSDHLYAQKSQILDVDPNLESELLIASCWSALVEILSEMNL